MCGFCRQRLDSTLIEKLKDELPEDSPSSATDVHPLGFQALINLDTLSTVLLGADGSSFAADTGAFIITAMSADVFDFQAAIPQDDSTDTLDWIVRAQTQSARDAAQQVDPQTDTADAGYWTQMAIASFDDWFAG